jgi:hypothetical protein
VAAATYRTWSEDKSPYFIKRIQVPESGELAIEPGVKVFFRAFG